MDSMTQPVLERPASHEEVIFARLYGEPMVECPNELYIPPEALRVFLKSFEGPLDLLLWLIRRQKFDVLDIPMATLTDQYMRYVELVRSSNLELAAAYLVMSATLMQIKSRLMLPAPVSEDGTEPEDPRAELMRRLLEYERIRDVARKLGALPCEGRDFWVSDVDVPEVQVVYPALSAEELSEVWRGVSERLALVAHHRVSREELSVREHMTAILKAISEAGRITLSSLWPEGASKAQRTVWFLALLELGKDGLITITQAEPFAPIYIEPAALLLPSVS